MNKAYDLNKYLLGKQMPKREQELKELDSWYVDIKRDGHYTTVIKHLGKAKYYTSSGKEYKPEKSTWLDDIEVPKGVYICERCKGEGKLGDRTGVALFGPTTAKLCKASDNFYVHDYISLDTYHGNGRALSYSVRLNNLLNVVPIRHSQWINQVTDIPLTLDEAKEYLQEVVKQGYEGIMLKHPNWVWKDTKSRTTMFMKWKSRPTADLYCIRTTEGEGKYEGMIGSLILQDSSGRIVHVGSGLSDIDRDMDPQYFMGEIIEIEYEQIIDTYIQPTYISIRLDTEVD